MSSSLTEYVNPKTVFTVGWDPKATARTFSVDAIRVYLSPPSFFILLHTEHTESDISMTIIIIII